jgi:hypothetical protein
LPLIWVGVAALLVIASGVAAFVVTWLLAGADNGGGVKTRVTLRGSLTLDGAPLEARFLGARVIRDGLPAACQAEIPSVSGGRYEIVVMPEDEVHGCGTGGAEILLWTSTGGPIIYAQEMVEWPDEASAVAFDASFSLSDPQGASQPATGFYGEAVDQHGSPVPVGTKIEAYVGDVRCGITSTRSGDEWDGFILYVAGPDSVDGCTNGATLTFRIGGEDAGGTAVHDLNEDRDDDSVLRLSVR